MSGAAKKGAVTQAQRVAWLLAHERQWHGIGAGIPQAEGNAERMRQLVQAMRDAGLYSAKTRTIDIGIGLLALLTAARRARRWAGKPAKTGRE